MLLAFGVSTIEHVSTSDQFHLLLQHSPLKFEAFGHLEKLALVTPILCKCTST